MYSCETGKNAILRGSVSGLCSYLQASNFTSLRRAPSCSGLCILSATEHDWGRKLTSRKWRFCSFWAYRCKTTFCQKCHFRFLEASKRKNNGLKRLSALHLPQKPLFPTLQKTLFLGSFLSSEASGPAQPMVRWPKNGPKSQKFKTREKWFLGQTRCTESF